MTTRIFKSNVEYAMAIVGVLMIAVVAKLADAADSGQHEYPSRAAFSGETGHPGDRHDRVGCRPCVRRLRRAASFRDGRGAS